MRILGGRLAGRELTSPGGRVRPTAEGVRGAWLDALARELPDARVLDLFAGTGALGLEALSRGAARCDFVESGPSALHALKANVTALGVRGVTRIFKRDALAFSASLDAGTYDIAFADPPYESKQLDRVVENWLASGFSSILTVEHAASHRLPGKARQMKFGDTTVSIYGGG